MTKVGAKWIARGYDTPRRHAPSSRLPKANGDEKRTARAELWNLTTSVGRLDVAFTPAGTAGYEMLRRRG
ncbi:MAG TPA: hypothetical protein VM737_03595 [Gemmatimonadota bacterium]|nr:hypothetical protein [Gemmatimonadota bacterium]